MPRKRKLGSVVDKCRVCLCDDGCMSDIFSEHLRPKIDDLEKTTSISIEDGETLPRNLCHVCLYKLDMWIDFRTQFVRSNDALQKHLLLGDLLDERAPVAKRKHSDTEARAEEMDQIEPEEAKKTKSETATPASKDKEDASAEGGKGIDSRDKLVAAKDSAKEVPDNEKPTEMSQDSEVTTDVNPAISTISSPKVKQIVGRRSKTTERRKESTKRWVARKKALLAATGENETDTDSMGSDDDQLSPVQKARAKCNAEKVAETQRRMTTRAFHKSNNKITSSNLLNPENENRVVKEIDSETTKSKSSAVKTLIPKNSTNEIRPSSNNPASTSTLSTTQKSSIVDNAKKSSTTANNRLPNSVRSELIVDGATFAVTSTLVLSEPHYLNPTQTVDPASLARDDANDERNTDIIDAVQLRRVNPINSQVSKLEKKMIDTCLNIEVEGTELEALQRVQAELAKFVEKDMKNIVAGETRPIEKNDGSVKSAFQILDRQLKTIVEKTIRKNLENTRMSENRGNNTFTGEFLKAAMRSKIFQPRVLLVRHEPKISTIVVDRTVRKRKSTETPDIPKNSTKSVKKIDETPVAPLGKRRSVQPAKYADYNTASPFGSEIEDPSIPKDAKKSASDAKSERLKTYRPALTKTSPIPVVPKIQKNQKSLLLPQKSAVAQQKSTANVQQTIGPTNNATTGEKHICGVCGDSFDTRKQVEIHFASHKKPAKQKMMRCKRCHAVVEARLVQSHVCGTTRNVNKCRYCDVTFRTEQLLAIHEESHKLEEKETTIVDEKSTANEISKVAVATIVDSSVEKNVAEIGSKIRDSYTCFVCDATFTDEEILKDHLQKHCDDMSEDERRNGKDYQCAICSETFVSEDVLETHVEKHLFDDEDDNPNLISIAIPDAEKTSMKTEMIHSCGQCSENFDSEMLLMLHMQAHEEEVAIAEWERRGIDHSQVEQHICVICDDLFATEDELSEHLDVHNGNAHICLLCDKPFLTLEELQSHVNTH